LYYAKIKKSIIVTKAVGYERKKYTKNKQAFIDKIIALAKTK